ncbi:MULTISPECIES: 1-acylglycerol-3-phosphate O-acyltransferase [Dickeya]|uniref:1-acylglycerol-3-phosphate O-acyltransferase n=1 Tax=Dickeya TaxID=204037 RepID=UPI000399B51E|nr:MULTISPECIES: 1-acylglycerol-3-phosphate O-acyltransferase [Dickeya]AIR69601.1 acyl-phosphate glycerol 3-phosphate acyltransferase [Dickeya fangzhongdai]KGT98651.1 acyl-phosphate glycerol 3-phosphate acyltransferase [Dickeya fangzhongdai]KHN54070.1 acyl-phosphate glycerol 3-phosphate acyltransferase [Dickeya fangzhongdai]WKV52813.1 1-acylglycerol-3-phosphate O-acyltransferase [Dickeya fangzhongdai]WPD77828.1 1-acylglycerol-3-phosphate O-acyltransferase [Dickeya fangzhongdai]
MLFILRFLVVIVCSVVICLAGLVYCLFTPKDPRHVSRFGRLFGRLSVVFGLKVEIRYPQAAHFDGNCIYIANHQNNYDMVTAANVVMPGTVTVGKKSLVWIPFFGPLYWLSGNLLIDRDNRAKAHGTISQVVKHIKERNISVWMFPEGTRSRGRGLLPFKTGAFHAAIAAGVPVVPICVSTTHKKVKLNRWNNGHVIVEVLPPVDCSAYGKEQVRELAAYCHDLMAAKIAQLDAEVAQREAAEKR